MVEACNNRGLRAMHETNEPTLNELEGPLLWAVEQVRAEPAPEEAMERSLEAAGRLPMQNIATRRSQHNVAFAGLVGLAATMLIAVLFWPSSRNEDLVSALAADDSNSISVRMEDLKGLVLFAPSAIEEQTSRGGKGKGKATDSRSEVKIVGSTITKDNVIRRQVPLETGGVAGVDFNTKNSLDGSPTANLSGRMMPEPRFGEYPQGHPSSGPGFGGGGFGGGINGRFGGGLPGQ